MFFYLIASIVSQKYPRKKNEQQPSNVKRGGNKFQRFSCFWFPFYSNPYSTDSTLKLNLYKRFEGPPKQRGFAPLWWLKNNRIRMYRDKNHTDKWSEKKFHECNELYRRTFGILAGWNGPQKHLCKKCDVGRGGHFQLWKLGRFTSKGKRKSTFQEFFFCVQITKRLQNRKKIEVHWTFEFDRCQKCSLQHG